MVAKVIGLVDDSEERAELDALAEDLKRFYAEKYALDSAWRKQYKAAHPLAFTVPPRRQPKQGPYLPLGASVLVKASVSHIYHNNYRVLVRNPLDGVNNKGAVVGVRTLNEGEYSASSGGGWDGEFEPASFALMRTQRVYLVALSLYTKPVYALLADVEPTEGKEVSP